MQVKLISITNPQVKTKDLSRYLTPEELIVYIARVSNPNNQLNTVTAPRLISYLMKHNHWSPMEHVNLCVEIKTSRAIAAQILRHRSFSFQEFSQRYSEADEFEDTELRKQADKNRQSSEEEINPLLTKDYKNIPAHVAVRDHYHRSKKLYDELIEEGVARECARAVLPLGTQTTLYMNGSVRSWIHYIQLRSQQDTQKEHREIAEAIKEIFCAEFPNTAKALEWADEN